MPTNGEVREGIESLTAQLNEQRQDYKKAVEAINADGAFKIFLTQQLPGAVDMLMEFNPREDPATFAVAACAVTQVNLSVLLQTVEFIGNYEEKREQLDVLLKMVPQRDPEPGEQSG